MVTNFERRIIKKEYRQNIVPALIAGGAALAGAAINYFSQENANKQNAEIAEKNLQLQQEQFEYNKKLQQEIFAREDSAHQREVTDLRAAGINPLATANGGQGAGAGAVVPLTERQNNYQAQAPQVDLNGLATAAQIYETGRSNKATENISRENLQQKAETDKAKLALEQTKEENRKEEAMQNYELELRKQGENERANQVHEQIQQQMASTSQYSAETARKNYELAKQEFDQIKLPSSIQATEKQEKEIDLLKKQIEKTTADINSQNLHDKLDTAKTIIDGAETISSEIRSWLWSGIKDALTEIAKKKKK